MRSSRTNRNEWPLGGVDPPPDEGFDSFGPVSDIWRALHPREASHTPESHCPHERSRILLAEHDALQRRLLRVLLDGRDLSLIEVDDGQAALDLLALRSFDLLLLDLSMPRMSGADIIRWVRRSQTPWADIPILGLAEPSQQARVGQLVSLGMTGWVRKPVDRRELGEALMSILPGLHIAL